ncbi:exodeoxyribonuclease III [Gammaproteobacteria bacterium LSUCC0112]|nr:exodeoxyribonuclease III [Gammaproteobacteria bacterium LSUCC0112]
MQITTFNCNGIRSAARKGFFNWLAQQSPDVLCLQETKAQESQLSDEIFSPRSYERFYFDAEKKGYSGTAIYTKTMPDNVIKGFGWHIADREGRYLQADFGKLSVISLYMPSGSSGDARQQIKFQFLDFFFHHLQKLRMDGRSYIICGDWNMCHKPIDLKNWKANQNKPGFLPEERAWLDRLYNETGYVDAFRLVNQSADQYSWWSNRGQARSNNVGWRLDYPVITPELAPKVIDVSIFTTQMFSDHAPVTLTLADR